MGTTWPASLKPAVSFLSGRASVDSAIMARPHFSEGGLPLNDAEKLRHAAYHEAAHAVVACLAHRSMPELFPRVGSCAIGENGGLASHQVNLNSRWLEPLTRGMLAIFTAGAISEVIHLGGCFNGYERTDKPAIQRFLDSKAYTQAERRLLIAAAQESTTALLRRADVKAAVSAVASALIARRSLPGSEILATVEKTCTYVAI